MLRTPEMGSMGIEGAMSLESAMSMGLEAGMSMGYEAGMSMGYEAGMSMGYEAGMSMPTRDSSGCVTPDLTNSESGFLTFTLEVEVLNGDTTFVTDLTQGMVDAVASALSWCQGTRRLLARNLLEDDTSSDIVGLEVHDQTGILMDGTCP